MTRFSVRTVAAPLYNHSNQITAALNISAHATRFSMRDMERRCLPVVLEGARRISQALGARLPETAVRRTTARPRAARPTARGTGAARA